MKHEATGVSASATDTVVRTEDISATERVLLARLENDLKSVQTTELPEFDLASMSDAAQARCEVLVAETLHAHVDSKSIPRVIAASRIVAWMEQHGFDVSDATLRVQEKARAAFEASIRINGSGERADGSHVMYSGDLLQDACALQDAFPALKAELLQVAALKKGELKRFALSNRDSDVRATLQLVPDFEDDDDVRQDAKTRIEKKLNDKQDPREIAELMRSYPKSFFTIDDIVPAAIALLNGEEARSGTFEKDSIQSAFRLTQEEVVVVLDKVLDACLRHGQIRYAHKLATAYDVTDALHVKGSHLYLQWLADEGNQRTDDVFALDRILPEQYRASEEAVLLKRAWGLRHLAENRSDRIWRRADESFQKRFNLTEEFLASPESQQQLQTQLLTTLAHGNYDSAAELYTEVLTDASKNEAFRAQIEETFLQALPNHQLWVRRRAVKFLDVLSETFLQTPAFREQAKSILEEHYLGNTYSDTKADDIALAIEKLRCTPEEVQEVKERALLAVFANISSDGQPTNLLVCYDSRLAQAKKWFEVIRPDDAMLAAVQAKLHEFTLRDGTMRSLEALRSFAPLGISVQDIMEHERSKEAVRRSLESLIQRGKLNDAVAQARTYGLSAEDLSKVDRTIAMDGVRGWLTQEADELRKTYNTWKHNDENIARFIQFFNISHEELMQDGLVRMLGGELLLVGQLFYNLNNSTIKQVLEQTLLITEEDMLPHAEEATHRICDTARKNYTDQKSYEWRSYLDKLMRLLPHLPPERVDRVVAEPYLKEMASYPITDQYTRNRHTADIGDYLIETVNLMRSEESAEDICTQTFLYLVQRNEFNAVYNLLFNRNIAQYVSSDVRRDALLPEYVRLFAEKGEETDHTQNRGSSLILW